MLRRRVSAIHFSTKDLIVINLSNSENNITDFYPKAREGPGVVYFRYLDFKIRQQQGSAVF